MPTTSWARFLVDERLAAGKTQDEVFDQVRERLRWGETSRSAYINLEHGPQQGGREPNPDEQAVFSELYGGRRPTEAPVVVDASLEERAVVAAEDQARALEAQVRATEANTAMLAAVLAQLTGQPPIDPRAAAAIQAQADAASRTSPLPLPDATTGTTGR